MTEYRIYTENKGEPLDMLVSRTVPGATILRGTGFYTDKKGDVITEKSATIVIVGNRFERSLVYRLAQVIARDFGQESVLVTEQTLDSARLVRGNGKPENLADMEVIPDAIS